MPFIVFEGPDGSGTSRHSEFLAERLRAEGITVLLTGEPTQSPIGKDVRQLLSAETMPSPDAMQLLFCADRADHVKNVITPALERGDTVICDRYTLSTIVYGHALGLDREWLENVNGVFPKPDLTFVTMPPFDICMKRIARRSDADNFERETFQRIVYDGYKSVEDPSVIFIDTSGEKETVAEEVYTQCKEYFSFREDVGTLSLSSNDKS